MLFRSLDERAMSTIRLSMANEILSNILDEKTTKSIWKKLESLSMTKPLTNKLFMKKKLFRLMMPEGSDFMEHLNKFNIMITQLSTVGETITEVDRALLLLASLPDSYDYLVTTLMYGKTTLLLNEVLGALIEHHRYKKTEPELQGDVLVAKSSDRGRSKEKTSQKDRSRSKSNLKNIECHWCHKKGHMKKDYIKFKKHEES